MLSPQEILNAVLMLGADLVTHFCQTYKEDKK